MTWIAGLFLLVYAALKAGQFAFLGRPAGYREEPVALDSRLVTGEPWLLAIAFLLTVPPALGAHWYHRHKFTAMLDEAVTCYGLIDGYQEPVGISSQRSYRSYEALLSERAVALDASRQLGIPAALTSQRLDRMAATLAAESRDGGAQLRHIRLAELRKCLAPTIG